jgi:hypothetical protein
MLKLYNYKKNRASNKIHNIYQKNCLEKYMSGMRLLLYTIKWEKNIF